MNRENAQDSEDLDLTASEILERLVSREPIGDFEFDRELEFEGLLLYAFEKQRRVYDTSGNVTQEYISKASSKFLRPEYFTKADFSAVRYIQCCKGNNFQKAKSIEARAKYGDDGMRDGDEVLSD